MVKIIAEEINASGAITFRRFMELALYCPVCGYYEKEEDNIGAGGDYYTSVSVGSLFGELLAFQFGEWMEETGGRSAVCGMAARVGGGGYMGGAKGEIRSPKSEARRAGAERVRIVEAGAHAGELARDVLRWMKRERTALYERLEYWVVEPSKRRRGWQERTLGQFDGKVRWVEKLSELGGSGGAEGVQGVIFSNELLDSMPVRRLGWDARRRGWFEWGVKMEGEGFGWTRMALEDTKSEVRNPKPRVPGAQREEALPVSDWQMGISDELLEVLPDGFTVELCPAAEEWWREAAGLLKCGRLMTIDYGLSAEEMFVPERAEGTLRAYRQHRASREVLGDPGEQDLTAHVNFSAIQAVGEAAGLMTEADLTQAQFLTKIAARIWGREGSFGKWTPKQRRQFQTLTHPEHLGRPFRVLVQARTAMSG